MTLYGTYATKDGYLTIAVLAERLWGRLCKALGLDALLTDARYTPWSELTARQLELRPLLDERFKMRTTDEWLALLEPAGVPSGRVNWGAAVFDHPQLRANGVIATTRHPRAGRMTGMGFPLRLPLSPARLRRHAPQLGAHTREILTELKYRPAEIRRFLNERVIRAT
jgi:crotonobetainyl-CoA:carnitine CoA-transferase CaiB-like acyl-CoA transferase